MASTQIALLPVTTLAAAVTGDVSTAVTTYRLAGVIAATFQATFVRAGGGTTCKVWIQTSLDAGASWMDVANFAFLTTTAKKVSSITSLIAPAAQAMTPGDAALADDLIIQGVLGSQWRVKLTTTGTYTGASSIAVYAAFKGL